MNIRIKAFLWDQLIRPTYALFNMNIIKMIILLIAAYSIFIKNAVVLIIAIIILFVAHIIDLIKYYKSGEFMFNYRKYKYPQYREFVKSNKQKDLNTLNYLNKDGTETDIQTSGSKSEELSKVPKVETTTDETRQVESN